MVDTKSEHWAEPALQSSRCLAPGEDTSHPPAEPVFSAAAFRKAAVLAADFGTCCAAAVRKAALVCRAAAFFLARRMTLVDCTMAERWVLLYGCVPQRSLYSSLLRF